MAGAIHTTVDGRMDGIMMVDGAMVVDGVMTDMSLLVVTVDGNMAAGLATLAGSVMRGMLVADMTSRIRDAADRLTAADPSGHRISPAQSCSVTFDVHASALT
jgi:hypothetical protein